MTDPNRDEQVEYLAERLKIPKPEADRLLENMNNGEPAKE
jgi:hypothetical protein